MKGENWAERMYQSLMNSIPHIMIDEIGEYELYRELGIPSRYWEEQQRNLEDTMGY